MTIGLNNKGINAKLARNLEDAGKKRADSLERLSTGKIFTAREPKPAERALSEQMDFRLRGLAASKRNINDAVSLLQTAESSLSEINNIIIRMKELNVAGATTTFTDQERRYLFIEYEALYNELERIAVTTEYNGIPLLNGESDDAPEELIFRIDDPHISDDYFDSEDINVIKFEGLKSVVSTPEGLGLGSARDLLADTSEIEGLSIEDVQELMEPVEDGFATVYDESINRLSTQRAVFGAMQSRLQRSMDFMDVYQENISAAKSKITDTDYAREVVKLTEANILMQATSGLLAQSTFDAGITLNLLSTLTR